MTYEMDQETGKDMKHMKEENQIKKLLISLVPVQAIAVGLPAINTLFQRQPQIWRQC